MDKIASQSCGQKNSQKKHIYLFLCLGNKPLEDKTVLYISGESSDLATWLGMQQVPKYIYIYIFYNFPSLPSSGFFCFCFFNLFFNFTYLFMAVLGLRFRARALPSCSKRGPPLIVVRGPLTIAASPLRSTGSRRAGSATVAHGPSCSAACGIPPDQGSNPCPLHRQADSQPLRHLGSPQVYFWINHWNYQIYYHCDELGNLTVINN